MVIRPFGVLRLSVGVTHSRIFTGQQMKLEPWLGGRNIQLFSGKYCTLNITPSAKRNTYSVAFLFFVCIPRVEALRTATLGWGIATLSELPRTNVRAAKSVDAGSHSTVIYESIVDGCAPQPWAGESQLHYSLGHPPLSLCYGYGLSKLIGATYTPSSR